MKSVTWIHNRAYMFGALHMPADNNKCGVELMAMHDSSEGVKSTSTPT